MRIEIDQGILAHAVQKVSRAVASNTPVPILSGILLEAGRTGLALTASSVTMSIRVELPCEKEGMIDVTVLETGSIVLPAVYLDDIVRKLPPGPITLEAGNQFITKIRSGKSVFTLIGMDPEEFPILPGFEEYDDVQVPSDLLRTMIRQVAFAVSTSESRPVLTGVLWRMTEGHLKLAATDGVRLASRHAQIEASSSQEYPELIIPGKNLLEFSRLLKDQREPVRISVSDNQVLFATDSLFFYSSLLDGTYPNVVKIIPSSSTTSIIVGTQLLLSAIERVSLLAKDGNIIKWTISDSQVIELSSTAMDIGDGKEEVDVQSMNGAPITVHINAKFITEALRSVDSEEVKLRFSGPMSPIVIEPTDQTAVLHLISHMRTHT